MDIELEKGIDLFVNHNDVKVAVTDNRIPGFITDDMFSLVIAQSYVESSWNPHCVTQTKRGDDVACGLMQILKSEKKQYNIENLFSVKDNVTAAMRQHRMWINHIWDNPLIQRINPCGWHMMFNSLLCYYGGASYVSFDTMNKIVSGRLNGFKPGVFPPPSYAALIMNVFMTDLTKEQKATPPTWEKEKWGLRMHEVQRLSLAVMAKSKILVSAMRHRLNGKYTP